MIEIEDALELISQTIAPPGNENVALSEAVGRVLAEPVRADVNSPPHTKSVMDGFAVRSEDIVPDAQLQLQETITAGEVPTTTVETGQCSRIMTGAPLPEGADAVIMVELANFADDQQGSKVSFNVDSIRPGNHVMPKAASFAVGETIFERNHRIRPLDIGLLAEVGAYEVSVAKSISASVLPTGNELVSADQTPGHGQIRNSNGPMLVSLLKDQNVQVLDLGIGRDDRQDLRNKIARGIDSNLMILSGGVSAGTLDLVPELLQEAGVVEVFHKVRVKPGKPVWFGVLNKSDGSATYVFGLPGNPVSSLVGFTLFVKAAIRRLNGLEDLNPEYLTAELLESHEVRGDRPTYWPGRWSSDATEQRKVKPLKWMGSSDLRALGAADALIYFPVQKAPYEIGAKVSVLSV